VRTALSDLFPCKRIISGSCFYCLGQFTNVHDDDDDDDESNAIVSHLTAADNSPTRRIDMGVRT